MYLDSAHSFSIINSYAFSCYKERERKEKEEEEFPGWFTGKQNKHTGLVAFRGSKPTAQQHLRTRGPAPPSDLAGSGPPLTLGISKYIFREGDARAPFLALKRQMRVTQSSTDVCYSPVLQHVSLYTFTPVDGYLMAASFRVLTRLPDPAQPGSSSLQLALLSWALQYTILQISAC